MRRFEKAIPGAGEMQEILSQATVGYLGLCDEGNPYVVPLNFVYLDGRIYFHGAAQGRKIEILQRNQRPRVFFVATESKGFGVAESPCKIGSRYRCVMASGWARRVTDEGEKLRALTALLGKCVPDGGYRPLTPEMVDGYRSRLGSLTAVVAIEVEEMTGKRDGWED